MTSTKILQFPGDPTNPEKPNKKLVLTSKVLGKGQYGVVQYAYNRFDENDVYAVKCIERKKVTSDRDMLNL